MAIFVKIDGLIQGLLWVYFKTDWGMGGLMIGVWGIDDWGMGGLMSHDIALHYLSWCYLLAVWDSISNFNVILLLFFLSMIQNMPCLPNLSTKRRRNLRQLHLDLTNQNWLCLKIQGWVYIVSCTLYIKLSCSKDKHLINTNNTDLYLELNHPF